MGSRGGGESDRGRCRLGRDENEERWRGLVKYRRETRATERDGEIERTNGKGARRKKNDNETQRRKRTAAENEAWRMSWLQSEKLL